MDLRSAVIWGTMDDLEQVLQTGEPADHVYSEKVDKSTPIHWASYNKFNDKLEKLIKSLPVARRNKALNLPNINDVTPLFEAIWLGPNPDQADADPRRTPEEKERWRNNYASRLENMPKTVDILLKLGANPFDDTKAKYWGNTPEQREPLNFYEFIAFQQKDLKESSPEYQTLNACKVKIDQARLLSLQKQKQLADIYQK